ncbi:hypothetical protein PMAYCL1PPCAC_06024, partial [Pristionchus mayeri]
LSLPDDIVFQIVQQDCISFEDRMNLRQTCKAMESLVARSDFSTLPSSRNLKISLVPTFGSTPGDDGRSTYVTGLLRNLENMNGPLKIPRNRHSSFVNLINRLFKRAHLNWIQLSNFDFRSNSTEKHMNVGHLLQLADSFGCEYLTIRGCVADYDPRMLDVICKLNPREELELDLEGTENSFIKEEYLLGLPPVARLTFQVDPQHCVSGATLLALVNKHRFVRLSADIRMTPETFMKMTKIVEKRSHYVDITLGFSYLMTCLTQIGIIWNGQTLITNESTFKICESLADSICRKPSRISVNYKIENESMTIS